MGVSVQDELFALPEPVKERKPMKRCRDCRPLMDRRPIPPEMAARYDQLAWSGDPERYAVRCWEQVKRMAGGQP